MSVVQTVERLGQPALRLRADDGAEATVLLHGAHLVSWKPARGDERLYLSPQAVAGAGKAVRGGVPVIFPQFERRGSLPRHGFARDRAWVAVQQSSAGGHAMAVLRLQDDEATRALWPHRFTAELTVSVAGTRLDIELSVRNDGGEADAPFDFTAALHTYLRCNDVRQARLVGLLGSVYEDSVRGGAMQQQEIEPLTVQGEIDRIYRDVQQPLSLQADGRRVSVSAEGFPDVVVWNPGPQKAAALADLPDDGWLQMLCIEAACIQRPVQVAPGQEWAARQTLQG